MSYQDFQKIFYEILYVTPLPNGDEWNIKRLQNADLRIKCDWTEVLYRTRAELVLEYKNGRINLLFLF